MKYYLTLGLVLLVITVISSGILAYINSFTEPIIQENQRVAKEEARMEVMPDATIFDSLSVFNEESVYAAKDDEGKIVGYTFMASLYGYSSDVKTMVGITPELKLKKIKIIEQKETPGLGANCVNPEFQELFIDKYEHELLVDKDGGSITSLTGATITTRTIANSIRNGIINLEQILTTQQETEEPEVDNESD
jgi:electron transport complex protein RnfG